MGEFYGNQHTDVEYGGYTYEELVEDVAELAEELGEAPTTRDAESDDRLPGITRIYEIIDEDWATVLADAGIERCDLRIGEYGDEHREQMLEDVRRANDRTNRNTLTTREYEEIGSYSKDTLKSYFGSWSEACGAAGIDCGQKHGKGCTGPNGNWLESRHELAVAEWLSDREIEYIVHKSLGVTRYSCDFYLPGYDLWVEVDGYVRGGRPNTKGFAQKLGYYAFRGLEYVVVKTPDELSAELDTY